MWIDVALWICFLSWGAFAVIQSSRTNRKYQSLITKGNISGDAKVTIRRKLIRKHLIKLFIGIGVFLAFLLILIFIEAQFDS